MIPTCYYCTEVLGVLSPVPLFVVSLLVSQGRMGYSYGHVMFFCGTRHMRCWHSCVMDGEVGLSRLERRWWSCSCQHYVVLTPSRIETMNEKLSNIFSFEKIMHVRMILRG